MAVCCQHGRRCGVCAELPWLVGMFAWGMFAWGMFAWVGVVGFSWACEGWGDVVWVAGWQGACCD
jgi:hypothetical protein